jgi:hypothetical protein
MGAGSDFDLVPDSLLDAAHLALCAAAILFLAAADILRLGLAAPGVAPSVDPPVNICRRSAIWASIRFFCSSKPARAAVRILVVSFVAMYQYVSD